MKAHNQTLKAAFLAWCQAKGLKPVRSTGHDSRIGEARLVKHQNVYSVEVTTELPPEQHLLTESWKHAEEMAARNGWAPSTGEPHGYAYPVLRKAPSGVLAFFKAEETR